MKTQRAKTGARIRRQLEPQVPSRDEKQPATERERLDWLLAFMGRDVETLRPGEWLDLRQDIVRYVVPEWPSLPPTFQEDVRTWHHQVSQGLSDLLKDWHWFLPVPLARMQTGVHRRQTDGSVTPVYERPEFSAALLAAAADLMERWFPRLRQCGHCAVWFVPRHGRQRFHDPKCAFQARWRAFAPRRKRDYHAEYVRKVKRAAPGARPQRRVRRVE